MSFRFLPFLSESLLNRLFGATRAIAWSNSIFDRSDSNNQTGTLTLFSGSATAGGTVMNGGTVNLNDNSNISGATLVNSGNINVNTGFVNATGTLTNTGTIIGPDIADSVSVEVPLVPPSVNGFMLALTSSVTLSLPVVMSIEVNTAIDQY
jgi:hypothetical protein